VNTQLSQSQQQLQQGVVSVSRTNDYATDESCVYAKDTTLCDKRLDHDSRVLSMHVLPCERYSHISAKVKMALS
jgi:hypothetical protein